MKDDEKRLADRILEIYRDLNETYNQCLVPGFGLMHHYLTRFKIRDRDIFQEWFVQCWIQKATLLIDRFSVKYPSISLHLNLFGQLIVAQRWTIYPPDYNWQELTIRVEEGGRKRLLILNNKDFSEDCETFLSRLIPHDDLALLFLEDEIQRILNIDVLEEDGNLLLAIKNILYQNSGLAKGCYQSPMKRLLASFRNQN